MITCPALQRYDSSQLERSTVEQDEVQPFRQIFGSQSNPSTLLFHSYQIGIRFVVMANLQLE